MFHNLSPAERTSPWEELFRAAHEGCTELVSSILAGMSPQLIPDVLVREKFDPITGSHTPLTIAVRGGYTEIVQVLLDYQNKYCGGDLKLQCTANTFEALYQAGKAGRLDVVELLLLNEKEVNKVNFCGETALHKLCLVQADVGVAVEFLTSRGAKLDIADAGGETCLFNACREGHEDVVRLLLARGADPNHRSLSQSTPLHAAAARHDCGVARLLVQHGACLSQDGSGYTPLLWAARLNSHQCEEFFLNLQATSRKERIDALELLGGILSRYKEERSYAYLKRAMDERYGDPADIIPKPQRPPVADLGDVVESQTPEELESRQHDWHRLQLEGLLVVERILGEDHKQVAVNCDILCRTLILNARYEEAFAVWKYGRKHSIFIANMSGSNREICNIFKEMLSRRSSPTFTVYHDFLHLTVQEMEVKARAAVQDRNYLCCADVNVRECISYIGKALPLASSEGELNQLQDVTRRLIRVAPQFHRIPVIHHALRLAEDQLGIRPADSDCSASFLSLVAFLAKCGADVSGKDTDNNTPLHRICSGKWRKQNHTKFASSMARLLLEAGADVDARNRQNWTPLHKATSEDMRAVLLEHYPLSLKCLAASVIVQRRVPYQDLVPSAVESFIKIHESC